MSASSQHPQENQKGEKVKSIGVRSGGWVGDKDIRGQKICVWERGERKGMREKGYWRLVKRGKKITHIHPVPLCGEFIRLREWKCQFFPGPIQMDLPLPLPLLSCGIALHPLNTDTYWSHGRQRKKKLIYDSHLHLKPLWPRNRKWRVWC